jgi:membrane protein DedA with SNARE-associated domain
MMEQLTALLAQYGLALVFVNVFLVQAGAPVPAVPTLMVAGALAIGGRLSLPAIILVSVAASLLGDLIWYAAGRIYGLRVLQLLCRISISPDSCVRQTETRFTRWGAPSLMFAKFIPGYSIVAPPLAGALRLKLTPFLVYSAVSAALWSGLAAGAGMFFYSQIDWVLKQLEQMGGYALMVLGAALALFIAFKWWERWRFFRALRMARISVEDLYRLMQEGNEPLVVDVRSASAREIDPRRIPGAIAADIENLDAHLAELLPDRDIILYCT